MDAQDGQVPAPRRPAAPRRRPTASIDPAALPFAVPGEAEPRVADLSALLADIDALRLTLQTDLSLAAAALEAGADSLAEELVDSDLADVRAFGARAADRLARLERAAAAEVPDEVEVATPLRRRRIMSAGPLMAAAAALIGFVAFVPDRGGVATPETQMTSAAMAGIELSRLAQSGAPDEQLRLAAEELNDELAQLIAQAADDPAAAQQALMLLETTTAVLSSQGDSGVLRSVMAETRALRERLRESVAPILAARPARPARVVVRQVTPALPRIVEQPEKERSSSPAPSPKSSPKPSASATPTRAPATPAPAPSPSAEPSPQATTQPSQEPTQDGDGPLPYPNPGLLPGL